MLFVVHSRLYVYTTEHRGAPRSCGMPCGVINKMHKGGCLLMCTMEMLDDVFNRMVKGKLEILCAWELVGVKTVVGNVLEIYMYF